MCPASSPSAHRRKAAPGKRPMPSAWSGCNGRIRPAQAYIDVEVATLLAHAWRPQQARLIGSTHDFQQPIENAADRLRQAFAAGADIAKIAMMPRDAADLSILANLAEEFGHNPETPIIALAMDDIGLPSRLLAGAWGFWGTFARLVDDDAGTAPGQPTLNEIIYTYRVPQQNEETCIFGVVGDPVGHSLSPVIHNAAFANEQINAVYVPFRARDALAFWQACGEWIDGLSITIPHKETLLSVMENIDEDVQRIGAMNTVRRCLDSGSLCGSNTDATAITRCLQETQGDLTDKNILILGAGGVARPWSRRLLPLVPT